MVIDVLVAGGGPAGSATAALLAQRGCRVLVVDRAAFPRPKACGDYLNPGCDEILDRLGARDAVARAGAPIRGMRCVTPDGAVIALPFPRRNGWTVPRRDLDQILLEHAERAGAEILDAHPIVALDRQSRGVRVILDGRRGRDDRLARLVVGADGLRSTVARAAGMGGVARRGRYTLGAYLAGLEAADPGARRWGELHLRRDGYCGIAHLPNGLANVTIAVPRSTIRAWRGDLEAGYWSWLRRCLGLRDRLDGVVRAGPFSAVGPLGYHRRLAGRGRVLLVGDAAAHLDPMTGQGVYLALRGAELCAEAAAAALEGTGASAVRGYARARQREFGLVFAASRLVQSLAFRPWIVRRAAGRLGRHTDLRARLIGAIGNTEAMSTILRPAFLARLLGAA